jgi:hypothetical protein
MGGGWEVQAEKIAKDARYAKTLMDCFTLILTLGYQRLGALINLIHVLVSFRLRGMWRAIDEEMSYGSEDRRLVRGAV